MLNPGHGGTLKWLVSCLAKLSVKEGGEEAARRWHRYLTAGADYSIPAWEITVFHGLVVRERFDLGADVYLAPYEHAMNKFDLPEEPEPFPKESYPNAAVLVRSLMYGPGVAPPDDPVGLPHARITFSFPTDYSVDPEGWFDDSKLIVDLLSIAARVPLLSRTRYVRLAKWIAEMDPNFAFGTRTSEGYLSDLWPKGRDISKDDVDAFVELSRSSYTYPGEPGAMNLAIRRLAASFSRPGGRFGLEDRILDVAIALEVLYGGKTGRKLAPHAAGLWEQVPPSKSGFTKGRSVSTQCGRVSCIGRSRHSNTTFSRQNSRQVVTSRAALSRPWSSATTRYVGQICWGA